MVQFIMEQKTFTQVRPIFRLSIEYCQPAMLQFYYRDRLTELLPVVKILIMKEFKK